LSSFTLVAKKFCKKKDILFLKESIFGIPAEFIGIKIWSSYCYQHLHKRKSAQTLMLAA